MLARCTVVASAVVTPKTRYARSGDVSIAYQVVGDGPFDLVFVIGNPGRTSRQETMKQLEHDRDDVLPTLLQQFELRRKAFSTVQRLVMENAFVAPLAFQFELVAMNKKVQGYKPNLLGKPKYDDVWLES